jgi:hypothetical protein
MERLDIGWPEVEPSRGHWRWGESDHQFTEAARHGVTVLPLLMGVPGWTGASPTTIPADPTGFAGYVARAVRRYGPGGSFWRRHPRLPYHPAVWFELWNEPYLEQFSNGGPRPAVYARLVKAAASAGRRASPKAKFLLAADTSGLATGGRATPWVQALYRAVPDLNRYFDGVAAHPYSAPRGPLVDIPGTNTRFEFRRVELLHKMFVARGAGAKPFWITEVGWSTCPALTQDCVSEGRQATYIGQVLNTVKNRYSAWLRAVFLYNYRDSPASPDPTDREHWFGLIRRDGSPKPAWSVLRANAS